MPGKREAGRIRKDESHEKLILRTRLLYHRAAIGSRKRRERRVDNPDEDAGVPKRLQHTITY